jgi:hypothetical protein
VEGNCEPNLSEAYYPGIHLEKLRKTTSSVSELRFEPCPPEYELGRIVRCFVPLRVGSAHGAHKARDLVTLSDYGNINVQALHVFVSTSSGSVVD